MIPLRYKVSEHIGQTQIFDVKRIFFDVVFIFFDVECRNCVADLSLYKGGNMFV